MHVWVHFETLIPIDSLSVFHHHQRPYRNEPIYNPLNHRTNTMLVETKRKQFDTATALAVHRKNKAKQQPAQATAVAVILAPSRKTKVVRTKKTMAAVATVSEPRRSARLKAKQLLENGPLLHNDTTAIGNVAVVETAEMEVAAKVQLPPPLPPIRRSVHWPEVVVSYENERPAPFSSRGNWFVKCFVLFVLVALVFAGKVPSHAAESTAVAIIHAVIPSEMSSFHLRGGIDVQSIGGEPYDEWRSSANAPLTMPQRPRPWPFVPLSHQKCHPLALVAEWMGRVLVVNSMNGHWSPQTEQPLWPSLLPSIRLSHQKRHSALVAVVSRVLMVNRIETSSGWSLRPWRISFGPCWSAIGRGFAKHR
jgi:hypothetical protein